MSKQKVIRLLGFSRQDNMDDEDDINGGLVLRKPRSFSQPEIIVDRQIVESFSLNTSDIDLSSEANCQNISCDQLTPANRVCRHPGCMEKNGDQPLLLCATCDKDIHSLPENSGHLVLDTTVQDMVMKPRSRVQSNATHRVHSHSDNELDEDEDEVDGIFTKKIEKSESKRDKPGTRLRRKKVLKGRRHTDSQRQSTFYYDSDSLSLSQYGMPSATDLDNVSISDLSDTRSMMSDTRSMMSDTRSMRESVSSADHSLTTSILSHDSTDMCNTRRNSKICLTNESIKLFFDLKDGKEEKEVIFAMKNVSLMDALIPFMDTYNLNIDTVGVYLESSHTPLPLKSETFHLGGKSLYIRNLVSHNSPNSQEKTSTKPFHTPHYKLMNLSSEDKSPVTVTSITTSLGTWSEKKTSRSQSKLGLFSANPKEREKHEKLNDLLASFSNDGLPSMPELLAIGQPKVDESLFTLEAHWSSIVDNASMLNKRQHDQQEAIWELLHTEVQYINSMRIVADMFMCVLLNLQQDCLLNEIETERMFNNAMEVISANMEFWTKYCVKSVQTSRLNHLPINPSLLKDGFKRFSDLFKPYIKYCMDQQASSDYTKSVFTENELFRIFVLWAEMQPLCKRLKLTDLLVKPMQRLTKYSLLLQAILRKTDNERQRRDLLEMISHVDKFVTHVNSSLQHKHERERLATIVTKLESYDAVDAPNDECREIMQEYSLPPDLRKPMPHCSPHMSRSLLMQSALRMKDAQMRVDVECLLFTDLLLICKANKRLDRYRVIKPPLRVDRIIIHELRDKLSFLLILVNEYKVPMWAATFHSDNSSIRIWMDYIKKSQDLYKEAKSASKMTSSQVPYLAESLVPMSPITPSDNDEMLINNIYGQPYSVHRSHTLNDNTDRDLCVNSYDIDEDHSAEPDVSSNTNESSQRYALRSSLSMPPVSPCSPVITAESDDEDNPKDKNETIFTENGVMNKGSNFPNSEPSRRNSRTDRRYFTDSIQTQDRIDRDVSIHKRLSLNVNSSSNSPHYMNSRLNKMSSADSLPSCISSSGVSSLSSLHHGVDGDCLPEDISETESLNEDMKSDIHSVTSDDRTSTTNNTGNESVDISPSASISNRLSKEPKSVYNNNNNNSKPHRNISHKTELTVKLSNEDKLRSVGKSCLQSDEDSICDVSCVSTELIQLDPTSSEFPRPRQEVPSSVETQSADCIKHSMEENDCSSIVADDPSSGVKPKRKNNVPSPDLVTYISKISFSEVKDGISSVELPKTSDTQQLSYAKMKQFMKIFEKDACEV